MLNAPQWFLVYKKACPRVNTPKILLCRSTWVMKTEVRPAWRGLRLNTATANIKPLHTRFCFSNAFYVFHAIIHFLTAFFPLSKSITFRIQTASKVQNLFFLLPCLDFVYFVWGKRGHFRWALESEKKMVNPILADLWLMKSSHWCWSVVLSLCFYQIRKNKWLIETPTDTCIRECGGCGRAWGNIAEPNNIANASIEPNEQSLNLLFHCGWSVLKS